MDFDKFKDWLDVVTDMVLIIIGIIVGIAAIGKRREDNSYAQIYIARLTSMDKQLTLNSDNIVQHMRDTRESMSRVERNTKLIAKSLGIEVDEH